MTTHDARSRRQFLRWLAHGPLLASLAACRIEPRARDGPSRDPSSLGWQPPVLPSAPADALDVFDLERVAEATVPTAHFGYIQTGVDGEATQMRNRAALERLALRPRRLVDTTGLDTSVELLGRRWPCPIVVAPAGSQRAFHPDGELATARAARNRECLQVLSTVSSTGVEEVNEARGEPVWYQLYPTSNWAVTEAIVKRVNDAGCPVIVLTVDLPASSNRLTLERHQRTDDRDCRSCHRTGGEAPPVKPMFRGTPFRPAYFRTPGMTWEFIDRLRGITDSHIVVKGLMTAEDARLAVARGVDGIWVSNHGGRSLGGARATIGALPEIASVVDERVAVIVDGGFRRGTDIVKALALGATAVAVGRPYLWGLGAFGQAGVERALAILRRELEISMHLAGTPSLADIDPSFVEGMGQGPAE